MNVQLERNKAGIVAALAAVACAAACAVPLLLAGGAIAGLGALLTDVDFVGVGLLAAIAAAGLAWWRRKRVAASKNAVAVASGSVLTANRCGCGGGC